MKVKTYTYALGIDPGTTTGWALWHKGERRLVAVESDYIHRVWQKILKLDAGTLQDTLFRVEDARQRNWFGDTGREKLIGAGYAKRDATFWEHFLKDIGANFEMVHPRNNRTKLDADTFRQYTGWREQTNEHARDAAMLVYGY